MLCSRLPAPTAKELREYFKYHTDCDPNATSLQEIVPGVVRVAVSTIETAENKVIYVTGMSTKPMAIPKSNPASTTPAKSWLPNGWRQDVS